MVPQNGWYIMENPIEIHVLGVTPIFGNTHLIVRCPENGDSTCCCTILGGIHPPRKKPTANATTEAVPKVETKVLSSSHHPCFRCKLLALLEKKGRFWLFPPQTKLASWSDLTISVAVSKPFFWHVNPRNLVGNPPQKWRAWVFFQMGWNFETAN